MFISKKKHNQIIEHKDKSINDSQAKVIKLEQELKEARDLKSILEKLYPLHDFVNGIGSVNISGGYSLNLPDTVLQYTEDILEGTKCIVIEADGTVKTGLTKQKRDTGFTYKLIRN
jgi:hypothetical protein